MDAENRRPVMGNKARTCLFTLIILAALAALAAGLLLFWMPEKKKSIILIWAGVEVFLVLLAWLLPRALYYSAYTYSLSEEGITLWRDSESVMTMRWPDTDVSLGSYIVRGSENNPALCAKALCFTRRGEMRRPQRFPKRAMKGAAGELCVAFSRGRLNEVYEACGGIIDSDISADGLRLAGTDTQLLLDTLEKARERSRKKAEAAAAKAAVEAERQAHEQARNAAREARQAAREARQAQKEARARERQAAKEAALLPPPPALPEESAGLPEAPEAESDFLLGPEQEQEPIAPVEREDNIFSTGPVDGAGSASENLPEGEVPPAFSLPEPAELPQDHEPAEASFSLPEEKQLEDPFPDRRDDEEFL